MPFEYGEKVAMSCNNLALFLFKNKPLHVVSDEVKQLYRDALDIRLSLASKPPLDYEIYKQWQENIAQSCENLVNILERTACLEQAMKYRQRALEIRSELYQAEQSDEDNRNKQAELITINVDGMANNFDGQALLHEINDHLEEAEILCRQSLDIRRMMAQTEASNCDEDIVLAENVAKSCDHLVRLLERMGRHDEAADCHQEALAQYRRLAEDYPGGYEVTVAERCDALAKLLEQLGRWDEAGALHKEAQEIRQRLVSQ